MGDTDGKSYYHYSPSIPAGVIAVIIFTALFSYHTFRLVSTRTWFCTAFVVGALCTFHLYLRNLCSPPSSLFQTPSSDIAPLVEIIGYACRIYGHYEPSVKTVYIVQTLGILLAPILFAASVYMFLGRIMRSTGHMRLSLVRPTWLTKIFVGGDIFCFLVQALGATMLVSATDKEGVDRGKTIVLLGLVLQIVIFGFFVVVAVLFHLRLRKVVAAGKQVMCPIDWAKYLNRLYVVSVIITIRNIYRVWEYLQGGK